MALVAWYPLNGTLKNQGCGHLSTDLTVASPVYENGIIGQNLVLNAVQSNYITINELKNKQIFSCSFWFKFPTTEEHTIKIFSDVITFGIKKKDSTDTSSYRMECGNSTNSWINWYGNGVISGTSGTGGFYLTPDTWEHMTLTVDGELVKLYHNGELVNTHTIASSYKDNYEFLGTVKIGDSTGMYVTLADLRIYDTVLSQREAKEISKGLCSHYQFNAFEAANKNYILNSSFIGSQPSGIYSFSNNEIIFETDTLGQTTGINYGMPIDSAGKTDFRNKKLTFTMEYKVEEALTYGTTRPWVGFEISINRNKTTGGSTQYLDWYGGKTFPTGVTDGWVKYSTTVTVTDYDIASFGFSLYMRDTTGKLRYRNPKIEVGEESTPWIPNPADKNYSYYNYYKTYSALDVSGFRYNGEIINNFFGIDNTPRYNNSCEFSTNYIQNLPTPFHNNTENFTFSFWFYPINTDTMCLYNMRANTGTGIAVFYISQYMRLDVGAQKTFTTVKPTLNQWNYIAITYKKGDKVKCYLNGVLAEEQNETSALVNVGVRGSIGASSSNTTTAGGNQLKGKLSDYRIYATELSANDILTIYKNSGIIDNERDIYTYDFNEKDNLIAEMDCPTSATSFQDTFTSAVIDDPTAPTGKALKLICTAQGTSTSRRGYYLSGGAAAWTRAKTKMISGEKYKLSMYVKMNKITDNFLMCIECASKQAQQVFDVGTTYRKIESTFTYDSSAQYSAITNYGKIFDVDDEVYISDLKVEKVNNQFNISKQGIWSQDFIETENDFPYNEYDKIEYIESPGDCYIDTLYIANKDTGIELDFQYTAMTKQNRLLGTYADSNVTGLFCYCLYINGSSQWAYAYNNEKGNWIGISTYDLNRHLLRFNYRNHHYVLDNFAVTREITGSNTNTNTDIALSMPLMAGKIVTSSSQSITNYSKMKIFSFKIFEKHLLQREFIPCKRKSDDTIGLYEIQTKQFFINSGSGTLVAGPVLIDDKKINDTKTRVYNTNELTCREMIEI